jgi:hypothetical protein
VKVLNGLSGSRALAVCGTSVSRAAKDANNVTMATKLLLQCSLVLGVVIARLTPRPLPIILARHMKGMIRWHENGNELEDCGGQSWELERISL